MTKLQKLTACFDYVAAYPYGLTRIPYYTAGDWGIVYTVDWIRYGASNCFGYSALFGYLARLCGYENVYWCTQSYHGWVEIDGLVYDPVFLYSGAYMTRVFAETYASARSMNLGTDYNLTSHIKVPAF